MTLRQAPLKPIIDWLIDGARSTALPQDVFTDLCERLNACGLPLWRAVVFVRTLHPQVLGRRFAWRPDTGTVITEASFELLDREVFRNSPMAQVSNTQVTMRCHLADPECRMDYPILNELRADGITDYLVSPLHFTNGEIHFASWATKQPGGFSDAEISVLETVVVPLTRVIEIRSAQRVATTLLSTYVGQKAGQVCFPDRFGAAPPRLSMLRSGCRTCAASPSSPIGSARRISSICSTAISIAKCRRSSTAAARF